MIASGELRIFRVKNVGWYNLFTFNDSDRVSARLRAGVEPGGIPMGLLEAARVAERLSPELVGPGRPGPARLEAHPPSSSPHRGLLGAGQTTLMNCSI